MKTELVVREQSTRIRLIAESDWEKKLLANWWPQSMYDRAGIIVTTEVEWVSGFSGLEITVAKGPA